MSEPPFLILFFLDELCYSGAQTPDPGIDLFAKTNIDRAGLNGFGLLPTFRSVPEIKVDDKSAMLPDACFEDGAVRRRYFSSQLLPDFTLASPKLMLRGF
jgi:hypothetical protein